MPEPAIRCHDVWKQFVRGARTDSLRDLVPTMIRRLRRSSAAPPGAFWALHGLDFEVPRGTVLGVIGPNGAGKSTLLKVLSRILVPDRGTIEINGRLTALIEVGSGFHPELTGRENIYLSGALLGMARQDIKAKLGEIVAFSGLDSFLDTPLKRYSSGMQARLGFSIAAHVDPQILLVDEVLAVGDAQFQEKSLDTMRRFADQGKTIVFISHDLQAVTRLCPSALLLLRGQSAFQGPTPAAIAQYMKAMRGGDAIAASQHSALSEVRLLDAAGQDCGRFAPGAAAQLTFDVRLPGCPQKHLFALQVRRATDGLVVSEYNLDVPEAIRPEQRTPVAIDMEMNCLRGAYAITLVLLERSSYARIARLDFVKLFDITDDSARSGLAHLAPYFIEPASPCSASFTV